MTEAGEGVADPLPGSTIDTRRRRLSKREQKVEKKEKTCQKFRDALAAWNAGRYVSVNALMLMLLESAGAEEEGDQDKAGDAVIINSSQCYLQKSCQSREEAVEEHIGEEGDRGWTDDD